MSEKMKWRCIKQAYLQIANFRLRACKPSTPLWYETQRKTTHVIFWS